MAQLEESVVAAVTNTNFKVLAEQIAFHTNNAMADAIQDQRDSRMLSRTLLGAACKRIIETDIPEAVANAKNATADLPNREVELGSSAALAQTFQVALATIAQVMTKLAQSTPPETGKAS